VKHAHARTCRIELAADNELEVCVTDDGVGIAPQVRGGVGLTSMRERASELGGAYTIEPIEPHGTRVVARLPLVGA
jgi:signal transduction histidine kinase